MPEEGNLGLTPETILSLPVETLAFAVLKNFAEADGWNRHNWLNGAERLLRGGPHIHALAEAWSWLDSRGLVARDPGQSHTSDARFVTRAGRQALERGSLDEIRAAERMALDLHPRLQGKVRPIFLLGDFETAAFKAMKEVEVRVREMAKFPADLIGVKLMREAFKPNGGPLACSSHEAGEKQARADLFAGAIGSFKNPTSHRSVTYTDPAEASEVILLADLLMRILDTVEAVPSERPET